MLKTNSKVYIVLEKSKETVLEFYKGTAKVLQEHVNGRIQHSKCQTIKFTRMNTRMFSANNLPRELSLTTRQTTELRNAIENNMSTDIKLSKAQISKIIQSGGYLGKFPGPLLKTGLRLIKNVIKPLAKSVLTPLGLTAVASAADAGIKKMLGSGTTTLIISIKK